MCRSHSYIAAVNNEFRFSFVTIGSTKGSFNWQKSIVLYSNIIGLLITLSVLPSFTNKISDDRIFMHETAPLLAMIRTRMWFFGDKWGSLPWSELITCDVQKRNVQFSTLIRRNEWSSEECASLSLVSIARSFLLFLLNVAWLLLLLMDVRTAAVERQR